MEICKASYINVRQQNYWFVYLFPNVDTNHYSIKYIAKLILSYRRVTKNYTSIKKSKFEYFFKVPITYKLKIFTYEEWLWVSKFTFYESYKQPYLSSEIYLYRKCVISFPI